MMPDFRFFFPQMNRAGLVAVDMSDDEGGNEHRVTINIVVSCFRSKAIKTKDQESTDSCVLDGKSQRVDEQTFEELDCRFLLTMFGAEESQESAPLIFSLDLSDNSDESKNLVDTWSHTFSQEVLVTEDLIIQLCRSAESSIVLQKASLKLQMAPLSIDLAPFVAGDTSIELGASLASTELIQSPYHVSHFTVVLTIATPFLPKEMKALLNPLSITIIAAEDLPDPPKYAKMGSSILGTNPRTLSISEIRETCVPAYCSYCFFQEPLPARSGLTEIEDDSNGGAPPAVDDWSRPVRTHGMPQASTIRFKHTKVFLAGLLRADDLIRHLRSTPLEIEVHDRDRIIPPQQVLQAEEGDGEADAAAAPADPPRWSGLRTIDAARAAEPLPPSPFAVCRLNLAPLADEGTPGRAITVAERAGLWPSRPAHRDFSAYPPPLPGDYVGAGSVLALRATLAFPLRPEHPEARPFRRAVMVLPYYEAEALDRLCNSVIRINAAYLAEVRRPPPRLPSTEEQGAEPRAEKGAGDDAAEGGGAAGEDAEAAAAAADPFQYPAIRAMVAAGEGPGMLEKGLASVELPAAALADPAVGVVGAVQVPGAPPAFRASAAVDVSFLGPRPLSGLPGGCPSLPRCSGTLNPFQ